MIFDDAILTTVGAALLARANAQQQLLWTRVKSTGTNIDAYTTEQMQALTVLPGTGIDGVISAVSALFSQCVVTTTLSNTVTGTVYAVGLWAKIDGDASDTLVAVARAQSGTAVTLTASVSKPCRIFLDFTLVVDTASSVSITVGGAGYAPVSALEATNGALQAFAASFRHPFQSLRAAELAEVVLTADVVDLLAVKPIGETIDTSAELAEVGQQVDPTSLIATDGGRVFAVLIASENTGTVTAYDADTFEELWETDCSFPVSAITYGGGKVFVGHDSGVNERKLTVLDAETGVVLLYHAGTESTKVVSLAYGNDFLVSAFDGGTTVYLHSLVTLDIDGQYDFEAYVHCVAARGSLVAACGNNGVSFDYLGLLDCSDFSEPSLLWRKESINGNVASWCGFVGNFVAVLNCSGVFGLKIYPVGRFAMAPDALYTRSASPYEWSRPVFGDFGVGYPSTDSRRIMVVNELGQEICQSVAGGFSGVAWVGNQFIGVDITQRLVRMSSTTKPVRVAQQFGQLALL